MSNLPPGCRVQDIPGNRPEDEQHEREWEQIFQRLLGCIEPLPIFGKVLPGRMARTPRMSKKDIASALADPLLQMLEEARDEARKEALDHPRCTTCGGSGVVPVLSSYGEGYSTEPGMCEDCHGEGYR